MGAIEAAATAARFWHDPAGAVEELQRAANGGVFTLT